jgi:beta-lactamase regulating signal transducer with metallopeptidase domain
MDHLASFSAIILDSALKATVLLALAWAGGLALKNESAAARHAVRASVLGALLLLPFSRLLPAWHVRGIPEFTRAASTVMPVVAGSSPAMLAAAEPTRAWPAVFAGDPPLSAPAVKAQARREAAVARPKPGPTQGSVWTQASPSQPRSAHPASPRLASLKSKLKIAWLSVLAAVWLLGAAFLTLRWTISVSRLWRLVRRAAPVTDAEWNAQARAVSRSLEVRRSVALLESTETDVPLAVGILHPAVILPPDRAEWSRVRRNAVLHHEIAHIQRLDVLAQAVAQAVTALYWFHPLAWLTVRAMRAERERACDDQVLAAGTKASDYAHELLDIASTLRRPELAAALAMARRSQLEGRVLAVLNPALRRGPVSRAASLTVAALVLGVALPIAAMRPAGQASAPGASASQSNSGAASTPAVVYAEPRPGQPAAVAGANSGGDRAQAAPAAPAPPATPAAPAAPAAPPAPVGDLKVCGNGAKLHHMSMESHDHGSYKHWTATWSGDDCSVDLRAEGEIQFNADATDTQSISSGGYFEVNVREGDTLRQVRVTPSGNGLQYVLKINGQQQPFEGEAKAWFSNFLLSLERTTGFAADTRVPRLLAKGGPSAVLDEINNLQGDYVRGIYFRKLLDQPNLPAPIVVRIINQAGSQIGSDYEMARVLMEVSRQYELPDETSRAAFLNAAGKLKSDYEHSRVLIELLKRPNISADNVRMALNSAAGIKSDYEKSRILLSLLEQKSFDQRNLDFYLKMVASINSDYEKSRDLLAPMQRYTLAADQINQIMDATAKINSDYEKSRLLTGLAAKGKFDEGQMGNYLKVVASMKSDYERSRSLLALMQNNSLSPASVSKALQATSQAGSDYEKSRVLTTLINYKFDESQINDYLSVVDTMSSDFERSRCLIALLEHNKLSDAALGKVLDAVVRIKSDYEKARVLQTMAGKYSPLQGALRESYIKAADSINSEHERNRVLAAVVRRATL